ncbi:MAG TPA: hypothetical protein VII94_01565 [Candidatus Saccharimonadales bacterium]
MAIRVVKQRSDRGSIKDLQNGDDEHYPATPIELRLKELYEYATVTRNEELQNSLGLVPIVGATNDPVSIFRHREYVESLSAKMADKIEQTKKELEGCFESSCTLNYQMRLSEIKRNHHKSIVLKSAALTKLASYNGKYQVFVRSFRRAE